MMSAILSRESGRKKDRHYWFAELEIKRERGGIKG